MEANREDDGQSNDRHSDDGHSDDGHSDAEVAMDRELLCPICLALLYRPAILDQCDHRFCEPCLIRLARAGIQTCPVCRSAFTDWQLDEGNIRPKVKRINSLTMLFSELHGFIANEHQDVYIQRQQDEMNSGIFNLPLPPVRRTVLEIVNEWVEESLTPDLLLLAMVILSLLIQFGIILMMKLILYQIGGSPAVAIYESFRPMMRVVTIAKLILRLMAMIIQLNVQWLRRSAVPGQDRTQQL